ncbi:unnamed protein product [Prunus armeniaca]|uniref:Uncharacterized protein n=1 Tax=Prunus armeniaca TaxID=36596 RepID=A0A6J5TK56_PRUAR|nr:unnamed protein product [Prunus armeniaca]
MANPGLKTEEPPAQNTPLLDSNNNNNHHQGLEEGYKDTQLDQTLQWLETFLTLLGFSQSSFLSLAMSWTALVLIGVLLPVLAVELFNCSDCAKYQIKSFELVIVGSQACLATVSLLCLSHNLRKYGLRRFLFVDRYSGHMLRFRNDYIKQIKKFPVIYYAQNFPGYHIFTGFFTLARLVGTAMFSSEDSLVLSWAYVSTITLTASILFHLVCNLQVIHFDDYARLLERESDVLIFMEEHIRLRIQWKITLVNGGDFAVSTIVQVVGFSLSLHAATRISHRAQGIASVASRWHALVTCSSSETSQNRNSNSALNLEAASTLNSLHISYSESDLESVDYVAMPTNTQLASYMSSYHRRQAFVMYLQTNYGGITIFGWTVDRGLLNTIFFIELSLITFVLGKTLVFSST